MTSLDQTSSISSIALSKYSEQVNPGKCVTISLSFRIEGQIRIAFEQRNWEKAYDKHDNIFRLTIEVELKSGRKTITSLKFVRKAVLFWTRSPKIPYRVWIMIVKDDESFYPSTVDEAKSLLFDIEKIIELNMNGLKPGKHTLKADIRVTWGKHLFSNPTKIHARSDEIHIFKERLDY
ncbi:MAG TPA: hypothetical protein VH796_12455 [Nitrososphaeraceae archaeon]|jgi:hypothetical protein